MTTQHTPGPWVIGSEHGDDADRPDYQYNADGWPFFVAHRSTEIGRGDFHTACSIQRKEDARLIAAAPDLLAALREGAESLHYAIDALQAPERASIRDTLAIMLAAVAKAEGRS